MSIPDIAQRTSSRIADASTRHRIANMQGAGALPSDGNALMLAAGIPNFSIISCGHNVRFASMHWRQSQHEWRQTSAARSSSPPETVA